MSMFNPNVSDRSNTTTFLGPIGSGKAITPRTSYKKSFITEATIGPLRLVKFGSDGVSIIAADDRTDPIIGVSTNTSDALAGQSVDVVMYGEAEVTLQAGILGGTFVTAITGEGGKAGISLPGDRIGGTATQTVISGTAPTAPVFVHLGVGGI